TGERMRVRTVDMIDPRDLFGLDTYYKPWTLFELVAETLRGKKGADARRNAEAAFKLAQADGPDGRWYCHQQQLDSGRGSSMWITEFWSPRAGFNPVAYVFANDRPDGNLNTRVEWEWTAINGIHVPSRIKEWGWETPGGPLSRERDSKLSDCVLNRRLDPHQF